MKTRTEFIAALDRDILRTEKFLQLDPKRINKSVLARYFSGGELMNVFIVTFEPFDPDLWNLDSLLSYGDFYDFLGAFSTLENAKATAVPYMKRFPDLHITADWEQVDESTPVWLLTMESKGNLAQFSIVETAIDEPR